MSKRKANSSDPPVVEVHSTKGNPSQCGIGKINSVYCKDFVTYDECTFYPSEYLNVIIGPNGTGKSTLVAAIVLGLGGDPKLLSRSSSIQDYIKNGKKIAQIDIKIVAEGDGKFTVFHRTFNDEGKSEYKVNEDVVSKTNFLKEVAEFKIQINNLCQFLPQDRVQDFAKMNPQEILGNTITSVCSPNIISDFAKLKELRKRQLNGKKSMESDIVKLRESTTRREELKQILERYNARKQFIEKLDICNAKKLWLEVSEIEIKAQDVSKDLKEATKLFAQRKRAYDSVIKNQEEITRKSNELKEDSKNKMDLSKTIFAKKDNVSQRIEEAKQKIREAKTDFEKKKRESKERQDELRNEARMLEVICEDLKIATAALGQDANKESKQRALAEQLEKFKLEIKSNVRKRSDINKRLDEEFSSEIQMIKKRIERSKNVAAQKLQLLQNTFPDVHKAVIWLEENANLFQGTVYKPMILELNVPDPKNSQYFENTIPLRDLLSFVCENKADVSTLVDELCIKQKLSINVGHSLPATECRYRPNESIRNLEQFGFNAYLIDLLDGPPAVLNYLCSLYKLHSIPIGSEQVNNCTDIIPTNIRQYFGGNQRYNVSISKYSKEPSLMQSRIQGKNLLLSCDMNEVQNLQRSLTRLLKESDVLKNERTSIEARINEIEVQCQDLNNQRRAIDASVARFRQLKDQLKRQELKLDSLKANTTTLADMTEMFKKTTQIYLRKIIELQKEKIEILHAYQKSIVNKKISDVALQMYREQTEELTNAITEATDNLKQSQTVVDRIKNALETWKKKGEVKKAQALNSTKNRKPSDRNFPYTELFVELPNDLEQLKETINDIAARLDCMGDVDQEIVTEYERRCKDIEDLEKNIADTANGDKDLTMNITSLYNNWYIEICRVVETLNEHFGKFMDSMSYVGEVLLAKKDDFDFDSYGIQIMVQYRKNVPLQALDRHVQSGGERAVAIAVYTLSLQHITHVPFRCVDEINQGMDARNERKIFDMLVDETTKTGRSQYFFVTPKLLPNLKYNDRMTVHTVFNGKMIPPKNAFSFQL